MPDLYELTLLALLLLLLEACGVLLAFHAVLHARSSQAAIAWSVGLVSLPFVSIPLYLVFGRSRFQGYVDVIRAVETGAGDALARWRRDMHDHAATLPAEREPLAALARRLGPAAFTGHNRVTLLVDGRATYDAMLKAIGEARSSLLVQFYIVRDDAMGRRFRDALAERARAGVRVRFLYDEIGSLALPGSYLAGLRDAGVEVSGFKTTRGRGNRFQINFRNHRKLLVVDGRTGFLGGLNLGEEYLEYRDTHLRIDGPASQAIQLAFLKDWAWATRQTPRGEALEVASAGDQAVAIAATGPADPEPRCSILLLTLFAGARRRLWLASPYFVPDAVCVRALQAAAARGVDVRVLLPDVADNPFVELASFTYYTEMLDAGVRLQRFRDRFLHQKVVLVDDDVAAVGTVNLDNRSLYLNFEATAVVVDREFAGQVETMLSEDLANADPVGREQYCDRPLPFRLAARVARLFSPLL